MKTKNPRFLQLESLTLINLIVNMRSWPFIIDTYHLEILKAKRAGEITENQACYQFLCRYFLIPLKPSFYKFQDKNLSDFPF